MVENVRTNEDAYIRSYMAKLPEIQKGETQVIKKGDSLWNIAREKLGKKSKRGQVQNYMMSIAKLNGLDTQKKMNNLKVNSIIYLPKEVTNNSTTTPNDNPVKNKPEVNKPVKTNNTTPSRKTKPVEKPTQPAVKLTPAEKAFEDRLNTLYTDKNIKIEKVQKSYPEIFQNELYHVTTTSNHGGFVHAGHNVLSFDVNKKSNKITNVTFEDDRNINTFGYDYSLGSDNKINSNNHYPVINYGKITPQQRQKLDNKLHDLIKKNF